MTKLSSADKRTMNFCVSFGLYHYFLAQENYKHYRFCRKVFQGE